LLTSSDLAVHLVSLERLVEPVVSDAEDSESRFRLARRSSEHDELGDERNVE